MKTAVKTFTLSLLLAPAMTFAQTRESTTEERVRMKTSTSAQPKKDSSDVTAILKDSANAETGPILNDNGSVSTTGTIDGRSSTGRPESDSVTTYYKRKTKIGTKDPSSEKTGSSKKSKP